MCLLLFSVNPNATDQDFYLILVNIRDEIYTRPTMRAEFWKQAPQIIGGMDLEPGKEGGTWLAMNKNGKIAALLNILQPEEEIQPFKKGRGNLVVDFLVRDDDCNTYLKEIYKSKDDYNGFLLVALDLKLLKKPVISYFSNATTLPPLLLQPGLHAFGNSVTPDRPWPKVVKAKSKFGNIVNTYGFVSTKDVLVEEIFKMLQDRTCNRIDENMKNQGKGKSPSFIDKLCSIFVEIPEANYGSRCHSIILVSGSGLVDYYERSRREDIPATSNSDWLSSHHTFNLM